MRMGQAKSLTQDTKGLLFFTTNISDSHLMRVLSGPHNAIQLQYICNYKNDIEVIKKLRKIKKLKSDKHRNHTKRSENV